jgi:TolA-binding protein
VSNSMPDFRLQEKEMQDHVGAAIPCPPHDLLLAYQEGVLPSELSALLRKHMGYCRLCPMLISDFATVTQPSLSHAQNERIAARLPLNHRNQATESFQRWVWATAAIAAFAVATIVLSLSPNHTATAAQEPTVQIHDLSEAAIEPPMLPLAPPDNQVTTLLTSGAIPVGVTDIDPPNAVLAPAFAAYDRGDYTTAAQHLTKLTQQYPRSTLVLLYLGVSQLLLHQNNAANATLAADLNINTAPSDATQWYAAIAALRIHSPNAKKLFAALCVETDSPYARESCRIAYATL